MARGATPPLDQRKEIMKSIALGIAICAASPLLSQAVGQVPLKLGEPQAVVVSRLSAYYVIDSTMKNAGVWTVRERGASSQQNLCTLVFTNGVLRIVGRVWEPETAGAQGFAQTLIRAMSQLQDGASCRVAHDGQSFPNGNATESAEVYCGGHQIRVFLFTVGGKRDQQISESWRADSTSSPN